MYISTFQKQFSKMAHILEEPTSGMRPEQEKKGLAKAMKGGIFDSIYIVSTQEMDDDDLSFFGIGGPA
jgi:hypothetical protein